MCLLALNAPVAVRVSWAHVVNVELAVHDFSPSTGCLMCQTNVSDKTIEFTSFVHVECIGGVLSVCEREINALFELSFSEFSHYMQDLSLFGDEAFIKKFFYNITELNKSPVAKYENVMMSAKENMF